MILFNEKKCSLFIYLLKVSNLLVMVVCDSTGHITGLAVVKFGGMITRVAGEGRPQEKVKTGKGSYRVEGWAAVEESNRLIIQTKAGSYPN